MKNLFADPEMEVFETVDIIATGGFANGGLDPDEAPPVVVG